MEELQDDLKIYSEEVRDVLSAPPNAIFKWGNSILLLFIVLLLLLSWFIKYPDIIRAEVTITTQFPPEKLIAKNGGSISKIFIENQALVKANTPIAIIENAANYETVFTLKTITDTLKTSAEFYFPIEKYDFSELGSIENAFTNFKNNYINYRQYVDYKPHQIEKNSQSFETNQQQNRLTILQQQIAIGTKELILKKKELDRFKILFNKGIISAQDWETREFDYLQQEKNHQNLKSQLSQAKSSLNDLNRNKQNTNVNELKDNVVLLQNTIQSFNQLKKEIADWDMNFVLRSSISGKVSYFQVWSENQTVSIGEEIFSIIPTKNSNYIAKLRVTALNSGKLKNNQNVVIRLANYPDREFGIIKGKLGNISLIPTREGVLLLDAKLPNGLNTSYKKTIQFQQEMTGTADIISEDLRLIERLLYQFRDIFNR
ncbi:HlyD family secretion protein [Flavobacterium sp.]|uniref:HlyD family secretion protein n=1 Tax=Flavobacterium sp. TaxID=239 RepID=UPI0022CB1634|nr:HlyD family efflux transporter periplasmic adaptor subunit [Flavobacterium sp.]MCZ8169969.1 HlyD family efflux transporter periplasmic adaptor subunit [Flavobacterium sp.]